MLFTTLLRLQLLWYWSEPLRQALLVQVALIDLREHPEFTLEAHKPDDLGRIAEKWQVRLLQV